MTWCDDGRCARLHEIYAVEEQYIRPNDVLPEVILSTHGCTEERPLRDVLGCVCSGWALAFFKCTTSYSYEEPGMKESALLSDGHTESIKGLAHFFRSKTLPPLCVRVHLFDSENTVHF